MTGLIFHLIPHTHWDREWYLPRAALQARLVAVTDDLIARLQAHPEYRSFLLDGQAVLVEDYLRARPDREGDVRALVEAGRRAARRAVLARSLRASPRVADAGARLRDAIRRGVAGIGGRGGAGTGLVPLARARRERGRAVA